jgi:D-beta-D-heptose 7-phosphate kinase/D-beta-D-heptose 1-phosphate adenosyltransferase
MDLVKLRGVVAGWRGAHLKIGFTNGCFDLLHPGHVRLLSEARRQCDRLIVGLNTDASVRRLKGPERPVQSELARAIVLASLTAVDAVVLFDEDTPLSLIEAVAPDRLIKGADYTLDQVVGGEFVRSRGGEVVLIPLQEGQSTTRLIGRMQASGG